MNVSLKQILKDYENLLIDIMSANKNNGYYKTTFNAEGISNAYGRLQSYVETTSQGSEKRVADWRSF